MLCCSTLVYSNKVSALADTSIKNSSSLISEEDISKCLNIQKIEYESYLSIEKDESKINLLKCLIESTNEMIDTDLSKNTLQTSDIQARASWLVEVAAVIGWFNLQGCSLSAELLTHTKYNKKIDSLNEPYNDSIVQNSFVWNSIESGTKTNGSSIFPNSGNKHCKDLYYAIHKFI